MYSDWGGGCSNIVNSPQYSQAYKGKWCLPMLITIIESCTDQLVDNGHFLNLQLTLRSSLLFLCITSVQSVLGMNQQDVHLIKTDQRQLIPGLVSWAPCGPAAAKDLFSDQFENKLSFRPHLPSPPSLLFSSSSCSELWDPVNNCRLSLFSVLTFHLEAPFEPRTEHTTGGNCGCGS